MPGVNPEIDPRDTSYPWYEYTRQPKDFPYYSDWRLVANSVWAMGDWTVHVKNIGTFSEPRIMLSLRHRYDLDGRDWNVFYNAKNTFIGADRHAIEVYPPLSCMIDSSNTYHILESTGADCLCQVGVE